MATPESLHDRVEVLKVLAHIGPSTEITPSTRQDTMAQQGKTQAPNTKSGQQINQRLHHSQKESNG
jgi:hypothetical protein